MNASFLILKDRRWIFIWLCLCASLVASMVIVGGYTRLSGSGLSITEWKPIHGIIPPLNNATWEEEFAAYRASPQYAKINAGMTLEEFKVIFWPEFLHRVLARLIGIFFFIPFVVFSIRKSINQALARRLIGIFLLGGLQGFMGWFMVKSGLVDRPFVSHIRLALHLGLAFMIYAFLVWTALQVRASNAPITFPASAKHYIKGIFCLLCIQILLGACLAGLHGGLIYNTFPTMNGQWIPQEALTIDTDQGVLGNIALIQLLHRWLAVGVAGACVLWIYLHWKILKASQLTNYGTIIMVLIIMQFLLGVATLLQHVPMSLALMHQFGALIVFTAFLLLLYRLRNGSIAAL